IHRVLERKKGLPILLSEIAVAVAGRLDLPIVGLEIPGRYPPRRVALRLLSDPSPERGAAAGARYVIDDG
ncbi:MAG: transglutaminase family protein, partial [Pseudomonadota bacterium]